MLTPIYIFVLLVRIALDMLVRVSEWVFYAIGGIMLLTTIFCYYMQLESSAELHRMIVCCGVMFLLPQAVSLLSGALAVATEILGDRIRRK